MPKLTNDKTATRYIFTKEEEELLAERMKRQANEKPLPWTPELMRKIRREGLRRLKLSKKH